jgi:hypothetical protein
MKGKSSSLDTLHLALRQQLTDQRQTIAQQLVLPPTPEEGFPRSHTMRFLLRRPKLAARIFMGLVHVVGRSRPLALANR